MTTPEQPKTFKFWCDAQEFSANKSSMLVSDIRKLCNCPSFGHFYQDKLDGNEVHFSDYEIVSLENEPHFFILLPATFGGGSGAH